MTAEQQVPPPAPNDCTALARELASLGIIGTLESHARLAVLTTDARMAARLGDASLRTRAVAAARAHGFTNLALELPSPHDAAAVRRD